MKKLSAEGNDGTFRPRSGPTIQDVKRQAGAGSDSVETPGTNRVPAMATSMNLAIWLHYRAGMDNQKLGPYKLMRLMYLCQAHYAAQHDGRRLIPAVFLANKEGPIEPNIFQIYSVGAPVISPRRPGEEIEDFLEVVWRKYGHHSDKHLLRLLSRDNAFYSAFSRGPNSEIRMEEMTAEFTANAEAGKVKVEKFTQSGKKMKEWAPRKVEDAQASPKKKGDASGMQDPFPSGLPWNK